MSDAGGAARAPRARSRPPIRVLLADDHQLFREGVRLLLEADGGFEVVGEVADGRAAIQQAVQLKPDVVLMDITMPQVDGVEATRQITTHAPRVRVLVLTMHDNEDVFFRSLNAGAAGYVLKRSGGLELLSAIRAVDAGESHLSPQVAKTLMVDYVQRAGPPGERPGHGKALSAREQEILKLIAEGHSSREIAEMLDLSVKTVHNHRTRLMTKLDIHRNADLVRYAIREGMVEVQ